MFQSSQALQGCLESCYTILSSILKEILKGVFEKHSTKKRAAPNRRFCAEKREDEESNG